MVTRSLGKPTHVLLPLLLSAALLAPVRSRAASSEASAPESLLAFERELLDAVQPGDRRALELLVDDDFEFRTSHAKPLGKKEFIDRA